MLFFKRHTRGAAAHLFRQRGIGRTRHRDKRNVIREIIIQIRAWIMAFAIRGECSRLLDRNGRHITNDSILR
jgi:hypothetical protein